MNDHEAGAHALLLEVGPEAPDASARMQATAGRFATRYEAYRTEGISHASAYAMARAEAGAFVEELDREGLFA